VGTIATFGGTEVTVGTIATFGGKTGQNDFDRKMKDRKIGRQKGRWQKGIWRREGNETPIRRDCRLRIA
jgi:hypothetical protein